VQQSVRVVKYVDEGALQLETISGLVGRRRPDWTDGVNDVVASQVTSAWTVNHFGNLNIRHIYASLSD